MPPKKIKEEKVYSKEEIDFLKTNMEELYDKVHEIGCIIYFFKKDDKILKISQSSNEATAKKDAREWLEKQKGDFFGEFVIHVKFYKARNIKEMLNPEYGVIELQASKFLIQEYSNINNVPGKPKYSFTHALDGFDLYRLAYHPDEFPKFKPVHMKGLAECMYKKKYRDNVAYPYHLKDMCFI